MSEGGFCTIPDPEAPLTAGDIQELVVKALKAEGLPITSRNLILGACALAARFTRRAPYGRIRDNGARHLGDPGHL
jgi:hypothetical protein